MKRRSVKNVTHFVKEIAKEVNKTTGQISTNNSLMNMSTQSHKIASAVNKNPLVLNHKLTTNKLRVDNKTKVLNSNVIKPPSTSVVNQSNFKIK